MRSSYVALAALISYVALAALALCAGGCAWSWPTVVRSSPKEPLFHSGFPLVGALRTDAALCTLVSVGPDVTRLVAPPEEVVGAVPVADACARAAPAGVPQPVRVDTRYGPVLGYLFSAPGPTGVLVAFTGLGMPPAGWIGARLAEAAARAGFVTFAQARDESARPMYFDPVREARRGLEAARQVAAACGVDPAAELAFAGVSMGGWETLLAVREARREGLPARGAALDPVLDIRMAAEHLDSFWHGMDVDAVQSYFRRILAGRYGEDPPPRFVEQALRSATRPEAMSGEADSPSAWLCGAERDRYAVFLSDTDPVLGDAQRAFAERCGFPLRRAGAPGHVPAACRLELFEELVEALRPPRPSLSLEGTGRG